QLIHTVIRAGRRAGIPVSMCGEMAGDVHYTRLLLGLGLTEFSMHPASLLEVKHIVNESHAGELGDLADRLLETDTPEETAQLLRRLGAI
ncbi:MAG TPA: phosphoenolpyruvate--protein phosphotransferase, partial [Chromatiales bacterium]|nr:phosphoenolpyruvate--protein phosphotransferase [Chromatiales bacterium]